MPFNEVFRFGDLMFYESRQLLAGGQESKARAVGSEHLVPQNIGGRTVYTPVVSNLQTVYRFPIQNDQSGYKRFKEIAEFANANFGAQIPTTEPEFQLAYDENTRWVVKNKISIGLNSECRPSKISVNGESHPCTISTDLAKEFLEHDGHPATIGTYLLAAAGSACLLEKKKREFDQRFQADGLSVARTVKDGIYSYTSPRSRRSLKFLASRAFLDLTEHEQGLFIRRTTKDLNEAEMFEGLFIWLYDSS